jgi:hypothetical protein
LRELKKAESLRFRLFDQGLLADDDDDAGRSDMETAAVGFQVVTNLGVLGKADVAVDDGAADFRVAANIDVIVDDGLADFAVAVDADVVADQAIPNPTAGKNGTTGDDGVEGNAHTVLVGKNEFRGGILMLPGAQGPVFVVEVEDRGNADKVHVGFVVGIDSADIAPVEGFATVLIDKVVGVDAMLGKDARKNVFAEIVGGFGIFGISEKDGNKKLGIKNVDAHGGVAMRGLVRRTLGFGGLFLKTDDAPVLVDLDHTELLGGFLDGKFERGDSDVSARVGVLLEHLGVIHFVDVVTGEDEDEFGTLATDGVNVLVNSVGGALVPLLGNAHLGGKNFDEFTEAHERRPTGTDVARKAQGFVLGESEDTTKTGVDAIGESNVDDAIESAKRNSGFGAIASEGPETFALTSSEKDSNGIAHIGHIESAPGGHNSVPADANDKPRAVCGEGREQ